MRWFVKIQHGAIRQMVSFYYSMLYTVFPLFGCVSIVYIDKQNHTFITNIVVFKDVDHRTSLNHNVIRDTISVCNGGRTRYVMPPLYSSLHDISDEFASAVCNLPVTYDRDAYRQFLDIWGTVSFI